MAGAAPRRVVIAGAGLAGLRTAESLRREGFDGAVTVLGDEAVAPYDRPPLSKDVLRGTLAPEATRLRPPERLAKLRIDLRLGAAATGLDLARRTVRTATGEEPFDALVIATGAHARELPALAGLPGVHTLRTLDDAVAIRDALGRAARAVVLGAGFVGAEVASSASALGVAVTVVDVDPTPHHARFGAELAQRLLALHARGGATLKLGVAVTGGAARADGGVRLALSDGTHLDADVVVVGVGVVPNVAWLQGSGLAVGDGVECGPGLAAGAPGVFAVGDVARWPNPLLAHARVRVEHWTNAVEQARHVARAIVSGEDVPFPGSGFVWSDQYGVRMEAVGRATGDVVLVDAADAPDPGGVGLFRDGDRLAGAIGIERPEAVLVARRALERGAGWHEALDAVSRDAGARRAPASHTRPAGPATSA